MVTITAVPDCESEGWLAGLLMDWIGLDWMGLDWIGLDWVTLGYLRLGKDGLGWVRMG